MGVNTSQDRAENATSREIINLVDMARSAIFIHGSRQGQVSINYIHLLSFLSCASPVGRSEATLIKQWLKFMEV